MRVNVYELLPNGLVQFDYSSGLDVVCPDGAPAEDLEQHGRAWIGGGAAPRFLLTNPNYVKGAAPQRQGVLL